MFSFKKTFIRNIVTNLKGVATNTVQTVKLKDSIELCCRHALPAAHRLTTSDGNIARSNTDLLPTDSMDVPKIIVAFKLNKSAVKLWKLFKDSEDFHLIYVTIIFGEHINNIII